MIAVKYFKVSTEFLLKKTTSLIVKFIWHKNKKVIYLQPKNEA